MRSTVSMKTFILTLVIFFIGVSSFFYSFLYRPEINKVAKMAREISMLKEYIEESDKTVRQIQELLNKEKTKCQLVREKLFFQELQELLEPRDLLEPREPRLKRRERPHGLPPRLPPGVRCVDCHLKPAPPN